MCDEGAESFKYETAAVYYSGTFPLDRFFGGFEPADSEAGCRQACLAHEDCVFIAYVPSHPLCAPALSSAVYLPAMNIPACFSVWCCKELSCGYIGSKRRGCLTCSQWTLLELDRSGWSPVSMLRWLHHII